MEILINAVAYPERVTNFQISKEEKVYRRAILERQRKTVNQNFFGKILNVSLEGLSYANEQPKAKSNLFY